MCKMKCAHQTMKLDWLKIEICPANTNYASVVQKNALTGAISTERSQYKTIFQIFLLVFHILLSNEDN